MNAPANAFIAATVLFAASSDDVFASGFDKMPTHIVEFTVLQPLLVETITCAGWDQRFDFQGYGVIDGSKCTATAPIPNRNGTQGGHVSASFVLSDGKLDLEDCTVQSFQGSGVPDGEILSTTIDCT